MTACIGRLLIVFIEQASHWAAIFGHVDPKSLALQVAYVQRQLNIFKVGHASGPDAGVNCARIHAIAACVCNRQELFRVNET